MFDHPVLQALAAAAAAHETTQGRVAALKRALSALKQADRAPLDAGAIAALFVKCLLQPHAYGVHAQLKACITSACAETGVLEALTQDLRLQLDVVTSASTSLWPSAGGVLREPRGAVPGWLELLLDVPQVQPVMSDAAAQWLVLLTRSLHDASGVIISPRGTKGGDADDRGLEVTSDDVAAANACAQEICKVVGLMLRMWDEPWASARAAAAGTPAASEQQRKKARRAVDDWCTLVCSFGSSSSPASVPGPPTCGLDALHTASPSGHSNAEGVVMLLHDLCREALSVATEATDLSTALASAHLLCATLDAVLPTAEAARALHAYLDVSSQRGASSAFAVAIRGAVQGASTATLCAPVKRANGEAAFGDDPTSYGCLLYGVVGSATLSLCMESVDASLKLFAFRALEALLVHMEAHQDGTSQTADAMGERAHAMYTSMVRLLFDNWEASFQSLTTMLLPLLKRVLRLLAAGEAPAAPLAMAPGSTEDHVAPVWLQWLLPQLRQMDWARRAKYRALQAAVSVLPQGACDLLAAWPDLLHEVFNSLRIPNYASHCEVLVQELMRSLAHQLTDSKTTEATGRGAVKPRIGGKAPPTMRGTASTSAGEKEAWSVRVITPLRIALAASDGAHAEAILRATLPALLAAQPAALEWILRPCTVHSTQTVGAHRMADLRLTLAVLQAARSCGLLPSASLAPHADALRDGLLAMDEHIAHDALFVVCCHAKPTDPASDLEMQLLQDVLPLRMKGCSIHFRKQVVTAVRRWLGRLRSSTFGSARDARDLAELARHEANQSSNEAAGSGPVPEKLRSASEKRGYAHRVAQWLNWFAELLCAQLYPGVPAARSFLALDLYETFLDVWTVAPAMAAPGADAPEHKLSDSPAASLACTNGFDRASLFGTSFATRLVQLLLQDFDAVRSMAFGLLARFPSGPLPGLETATELRTLLLSTLPLLQSARVYESDAGAAILRLVAHRYVGTLGWVVSLSASAGGGSGSTRVSLTVSEPNSPSQASPASAMQTLLDGITAVVRRGLDADARDTDGVVAAGCAEAPDFGGHVHGFLTALRHAAIDMQARVDSGEQTVALRGWYACLPATLDICAAACEATMDVLCGGGDNVIDGGGGSVADSVFLGNAEDDADNEQQQLHDATPSRVTATGKLRVVLAWLLLKEATLCAGHALALAIPRRGKVGGTALTGASALARSQIDDAGRSLVSVLLQSRHTGVIERAAQALALASERLLACPVGELVGLPAEWLAEMLTTAFGNLDDELRDGLHLSHACCARLDGNEAPRGGTATRALTFLRRSAGLPHAAIAILSAEPAGRSNGASGGPIFQAVMATLIRRAGMQHADEASSESAEWLPRVHALNLLRMVFLNKAFVLQTMPHVGAGFLVGLEALSADAWHVRNSGMLLFAALLERALRHRRTREDADAPSSDDANGIGVRDFFGRAPALLSFLTSALSNAATDCRGGASKQVVGGGALHVLDPFPMLLLLSRLVPSPEADGQSDAIAALIPMVRSCGHSRSLRVRQTAALALVPLVGLAERPRMLVSLAEELSSSRTHNHAHGVLLQMRALTTPAATSVRVNDSRADAAAMHAPVLCALDPSLYRLTQPCNTVRAAMAHLLGEITLLAPPTSLDSIMTAVQQAAIRDAEEQEARAAAVSTPAAKWTLDEAAWRVELHRLDVQLRLVVGDHSGAEAALIRLVRDRSYEVRLMALLLARTFLSLPDAHIDDGVPVVRKSVLATGRAAHRLSNEAERQLGEALLAAASEPPSQVAAARACHLHVLRLLCDMRLDVQMRASAQLAARMNLRPQRDSASACHTNRDPELRAVALELAAGSAADEDEMGAWEAELEAAAAEDMPVGLRVAAARALGAREPASARGWLLALGLLEDDDEEVREAMASALGETVAPRRHSRSALAPAVVWQLGWARLAKLYSAADIRAALAQRRAVAAAGADGVQASTPAGRGSPGSTFAVFPAEALNFYAEPVVEAQMMAHVVDSADCRPLGWSDGLASETESAVAG